MPLRLGITELLIVLAIVLLIFGAGKLPQIGSGMGKAIGDFRQGLLGKDERTLGAQKGETDGARSLSEREI